MDSELIFVMVAGLFVNILVLYQLIKIYKNFVGVLLRFALFLGIEAIGVFFISRGMLLLTVLTVLILAFYIIALGFRVSSKTGNNKKEQWTYESIANATDEERKQMKEELKKARQTNVVTNTIICPHCDSINVDFVQNNKKGFSVGKAAAGAALTGGVGTLAGFAGKKGNNTWHCKACGNLFETKGK